MRLLRLSLFLVIAASLTACGRKPNLLFITFDTTRADHMGYANGHPEATPTLSRLADGGTWFATCITAYPLTLPSHTSMMTGLYSYHNGVRNNGTYVVPKSDVTLAQILHEHDYAAHAIVSAFVLDRRFGLDKGFDSYDDDLAGGPKQKMFMFKELRGNQTADKAIAWLSSGRPRGKPFFLWVHFFDPHNDYDPPAEDAALFPGDNYSANLHFADRQLARILAQLDTLGLRRNTLIAFASDHGQGLGNHGEATHGLFIYDSTVRVPLIFNGPGVPKGKSVQQVVRTVDILPTVLDLLHLPVPAHIDGQNLVPLWNGTRQNRVAYTETFVPYLNFGWGQLRSLRDWTVKAINAPKPEVYEMQKDPHEEHNLAANGTVPSEARPFFADLKKIEAADPFEHGGQQPGKMDAETTKRLAALGYIWVREQNKGPRPDPKDRIGFWDRFELAQDMIRDGKNQEAATALTNLLQEDPNNVMAMGSLANALARIHEQDRALAIFQRMIQIDPREEPPYLGAAAILRKKKQFPAAMKLLQAALTYQPRDPEIFAAVGDVYLDQNQFDSAEQWFRKALDLEPHSMTAAAGLGNCLNRSGNPQQAYIVLSKAHQHDPSDGPVTYDLAVVTEHLGHPREAFPLYQLATKEDPDNSEAWNNLGSLLDRMGKHPEALQNIEKAHQLDPDNTEATYNLGALMLQNNQTQKALPLLEQARKERPDLLQASVMCARAYAKLGRDAEALGIWTSLAQKNPEAWLPAAQLEARMGRTAAARSDLQKALAAGGDKVRQAAENDPQLKPLLGGG